MDVVTRMYPEIRNEIIPCIISGNLIDGINRSIKRIAKDAISRSWELVLAGPTFNTESARLDHAVLEFIGTFDNTYSFEIIMEAIGSGIFPFGIKRFIDHVNTEAWKFGMNHYED